ncbi:hypothetical protein WN944_025605 [Citrus x changshan-huyou]|uniref:Uncharacterized protein n=1 Tax=Citrus x changshan-huyou TaxID=2935761 RepID=A0AAP0LWF2_9ROSI
MAVVRFLIPTIKALSRIPKHQEGIAYSALRIVAFDLAEEKFHFVSLPNIADPSELKIDVELWMMKEYGVQSGSIEACEELYHGEMEILCSINVVKLF